MDPIRKGMIALFFGKIQIKIPAISIKTNTNGLRMVSLTPPPNLRCLGSTGYTLSPCPGLTQLPDPRSISVRDGFELWERLEHRLADGILVHDEHRVRVALTPLEEITDYQMHD